VLKNGWWNVLFSVVFGLLGGGILFLVTRPPRGQPIQLLPAPTATSIIIYITGAVNQPGVYTLPPGSRVQDGISRAGGFLPNADPQSINLAAMLKDGERVFVPEVTDNQFTEDSRSPEVPSTVLQYPIDINTASQAELESLPEIGPVTAADIVAYRDQNGAFKSIEEIENVPGIGPKTFESIKEFITVGGP